MRETSGRFAAAGWMATGAELDARSTGSSRLCSIE